MAAVLACGPEALLSHDSAAELWGIVGSRTRAPEEGEIKAPSVIHVSVPSEVERRRTGLEIHRRRLEPEDRAGHAGIPVTSPARTLVDLACRARPDQLEAAVSEADKLGLVDPEELRRFVNRRPGLAGAPVLRSVLDHRTFRLTDSELERRFLRLVERAGLPRPLTQKQVNGFKVDFYWPELRLIVETDGLRYHRTPAQQAKDRLRDQALAPEFTPLRFTHAQVAYDREHVKRTLQRVAVRQTA
jgi:very-short-patch-repair endonuclease